MEVVTGKEITFGYFFKWALCLYLKFKQNALIQARRLRGNCRTTGGLHYRFRFILFQNDIATGYNMSSHEKNILFGLLFKNLISQEELNAQIRRLRQEEVASSSTSLFPLSTPRYTTL